MTTTYQKKVKLARKTQQIRWAPYFAVIKKHGMGKKAHPSQVTAVKRHWRRTKLKIKPRRAPKTHMG